MGWRLFCIRQESSIFTVRNPGPYQAAIFFYRLPRVSNVSIVRDNTPLIVRACHALTILAVYFHSRAPPVSDSYPLQKSETEEIKLKKRYFRMKTPECKREEIEWIEMTGREFYRFVNSPEGQGRHFVDMDDIVLEGASSEVRRQRAEKDHSNYLKEQEEGWSTLSFYAVINEYGCSGEEVAVDETQNVEVEAIKSIERKALVNALSCLDMESRQLIYSLYLAEKCKTERSLASEWGVSKNTIHKRKKIILENLKNLVGKFEKSSQ